MMDTLSVADAMALKNNDNMDGFGGGWIWVMILFLFVFGGQNGFGQNGFGGAATAAAQQEILLGQQFEGVHNKLDSIGKGICDSAYALNNSILGEGRALQGQLAECCCNTQLGIERLGAHLDRQSCEITNAIHAEADATRAMMRENEIQNLRDKVNDLQRDASLCGVVRYPMQMAYATNCNPFCAPNPCSYGNNCQNF